MIKKQRGQRNEARNAAIYLTRKLRLDTYREIDEQYGIDNDRTVRSVSVRIKKTLGTQKKLNTPSDLSFCPCSALHQELQPIRLHPLMRLEHEQKSGAISVDFIPSVSLNRKWELTMIKLGQPQA